MAAGVGLAAAGPFDGPEFGLVVMCWVSRRLDCCGSGLIWTTTLEAASEAATNAVGSSNALRFTRRRSRGESSSERVKVGT